MDPIYDQRGIRFYHGDCLPVMATMPAASVDVIFTSPPYNLSRAEDGRVRRYAPTDTPRRKGGKWDGGLLLQEGYDGHGDDLPYEEYRAWQQEVLRACWRLLSDRGAIYYNHKPRVQQGRLQTPLDYVPDELRDSLRQIVIWARAGGVNFTDSFYLPTHEWIVILAKPAFRLNNRGTAGVGDVWTIPQDVYKDHPAPFPLELPKLALSTIPVGTVLDPFVGSGTTMVAAEQLGWKGIGIDKSDTYLEMAKKRLERLGNKRQLDLFVGDTDGHL